MYVYALGDPLAYGDPTGEDQIIFYYIGVSDANAMFEKAASSYRKELENKSVEPVRMIPVATAKEFRAAWNGLAESDVEVSGVAMFVHGGVDKWKDAGELYFKPDESYRDGVFTARDIAKLGRLNLAKEATIDIHACRSGLGEPSAAQAFADSQRVPALGREGVATFSKSYYLHEDATSEARSVYLESYERGKNRLFSPLGIGGLMWPRTFSPAE
jgi:hypothetical protein